MRGKQARDAFWLENQGGYMEPEEESFTKSGVFQLGQDRKHRVREGDRGLE